MANKVFISFRFSDGKKYKDILVEKFKELSYTINKSEDKNRSGMSEDTIQKYLYEKLSDSSITIVILTPNAINYHVKDNFSYKKVYDDWLYDELRYSLEDRTGNRTNGIIALYTPEAKNYVISSESEEVTKISNFENLVRKNMFNVKNEFKHCKIESRWDADVDHYISLIDFEKFINNPKHYIDLAIEKRNRLNEFNLVKRMNP